MTGVSHAITGAVIAAVIKEPFLALPLAFLSHFVCDMVPHVGLDGLDEQKRRRFADRIHLIDLGLILLFFGILISFGVSWVIIAGAFLAGSPDFVWFYRYIIKEKILKTEPGKMNIFNRIHVKIQWSETLRLGIPVELTYGSVMLLVLRSFV